MCIMNILVTVIIFTFGIIDASITKSRQSRWVVDDSGCRTPDGGVGNCVPLSQCKTIKDLTLSTENHVQVHKYFCSYKGSVISVCCPSKPIQIDGTVKSNTNANLLPNECGSVVANQYITNGEETDLFEFPWQVALRYDDNKNPFACAGSLINNRYVLTAAHCTRDLPVVGIRLGEHNFLTNPDCQKELNRKICAPNHIDINITRRDIIEHESYTPRNFRNDIALIRLPRQIEFSESVSPICLPIKESYVKNLSNLTVIGWGLTETSKPSSILRKVTVPLINFNLCRRVFREKINITDNHFCAGGTNGKDSCRGDSGGPIMYFVINDDEIRWVQAGIVSFGSKYCGTERVPAMYTKMTAFTDWVLDKLRP